MLTIIGIIALAIVLRILRRYFQIMDVLIYIFIVGASIVMWISEGFWVALVCFLILGFATVLLAGMGGGTEIRKFGNKYTLKCEECGYESLEIIKDEGDTVVTKCKRCKQITAHILNH